MSGLLRLDGERQERFSREAGLLAFSRSRKSAAARYATLTGLVLAAIAATSLPATTIRAVELRSPDGRLSILVDVKSCGEKPGCLFYRLSYDGRTVLADSQLGLTLKDAPPLEQGFRIAKSDISAHDETWKPVYGERSGYRDHYRQLMLELVDGQPSRTLQLIFRAYDEGAAFCYSFPRQAGANEFTIVSENTRFHFTGNHTVWTVYTAQGDYAGIKGHGGSMPLGKIKSGAERPMPVRMADDLYAALGEARLVDYARMKFRVAKGLDNTLESVLDGPVEVKTPYRSPWRVVMVADCPGKLLEHDYLFLNLNDPCAIGDTSWIQPGKVLRETTLTTAGGRACVDFCVAHHFRYVLFDAGWYGPEGDKRSDARRVNVDPARNRAKNPLDLQNVLRYAKSKGIGIILYVNHLAAERQLDEILPLYEQWGVRGVKLGFVNVGPQQWTTWLNAAARQCAAHKLMLDVHDEYRPSGYCRTYPNWMTVEGIGGNEEFPTPIHNATLPFSRFLVGAADYTFCWYSPRLVNSHAHQLAISVIFYSPWSVLYWYDRPQQYRGEKELEFWDDLPTVWDDTRVINGSIGEYVSVARRKADAWWLGTIQAVQHGPLRVPLNFLEPDRKYTATVYSDANRDGSQPRSVKIERLAVDRSTVLTVDIPANGGHAVRIVPVGSK
jgi:alpha-glucosidase